MTLFLPLSSYCLWSVVAKSAAGEGDKGMLRAPRVLNDPVVNFVLDDFDLGVVDT